MAFAASAVTFVIAESKDLPLPEDLCDVRASKLQMMLCPSLIKKPTSKATENEKHVSINS